MQKSIKISGKWTVENLPTQIAYLEQAGHSAAAMIDATALEEMDSAGALAIAKFIKKHDISDIINMSAAHLALLKTVIAINIPALKRKQPFKAVHITEYVGKKTHRFFTHLLALLEFVGETATVFFAACHNVKRFRFGQIARHVHEIGVQAIPIIALMAFLISIVLTYQGSEQLRPFGAEVFTVNLVAISVLREMGVLLTAIMVAGRSGSAFAAEIGIMKINEEVDALKTIGMNPMEILVLPRVLAMIIALPLLSFIANMSGLAAAAISCNLLLDMPFPQFAERVASLKLWHFWIGIIKAPTFAFLIAIIGCERGMRVHSSAEMIGRHTTLAVVRAIFAVLLADALFSILFSTLKI